MGKIPKNTSASRTDEGRGKGVPTSILTGKADIRAMGNRQWATRGVDISGYFGDTPTLFVIEWFGATHKDSSKGLATVAILVLTTLADLI